MRFRFEVRDLHVTKPGAVEIQAQMRGGRYVPLSMRESGRGIPDPRATHILTHRPDASDPLGPKDVIKVLRKR